MRCEGISRAQRAVPRGVELRTLAAAALLAAALERSAKFTCWRLAWSRRRNSCRVTRGSAVDPEAAGAATAGSKRGSGGEAQGPCDEDAAATKIQKIVRGFLTRRLPVLPEGWSDMLHVSQVTYAYHNYWTPQQWVASRLK